MFHYGVIVDSFGLGFEKGVRKAAELGADGIQMYLVSGEMCPETLSPGKIRETQALFRDCGLKISAVCGDIGGHGFSNSEENGYRVERSKLIMTLARELGTRIVTTHMGVIPSDSSSETYKIMSEAAYQLGKYADMLDMSFAIETGPEKAVVLKGFLDQFDCRGMRVNLDPANLVMVAGDDPVEAVHTLKDYIVHTHAKDGVMLKASDPRKIYGVPGVDFEGELKWSDYFLETPLGEGQVDFPRYLAALNDIGYQGYLTLEREVGADPAADIRAGLDFLKTMVESR